jgi:hypothetical protein
MPQPVSPLPQDPASAENFVATMLMHVKQPSPRLDIDTTVDETLWDAYVEECLGLTPRAIPWVGIAVRFTPWPAHRPRDQTDGHLMSAWP